MAVNRSVGFYFPQICNLFYKKYKWQIRQESGPRLNVHTLSIKWSLVSQGEEQEERWKWIWIKHASVSHKEINTNTTNTPSQIQIWCQNKSAWVWFKLKLKAWQIVWHKQKPSDLMQCRSQSDPDADKESRRPLAAGAWSVITATSATGRKVITVGSALVIHCNRTTPILLIMLLGLRASENSTFYWIVLNALYHINAYGSTAK